MSSDLPTATRVTDPGLRKLYQLENRWQAWIDVEVALAKAQAELGIIPAAAADAIAKVARLELMDRARIDEGFARTGHTLVPLVWELGRIVGEPHGGWVHWGATTQNITQTGDLLVLRQAHAIFLRLIGEALSAMADLAERGADMPIAGRTGTLSWEMWVVALGYAAYFILRRRLRTDHLAGHWLDMALLVPAALYFIARPPISLALLPGNPALWALLALLGVLSAVALALYMAASGWLPMGLFGLLSYVEPVLLVLVALLLGESIAPEQWPTYALVFAAVGVLVLDGIRQFVRERRRQRERLAAASTAAAL